MSPRPYNVLFLCTGNSARSIIAESLLNGLGGGRFHAFSAGSHPAGRVHPLALEVLSRGGYPVEGLRSKSWDEFARPEAPRIDFVITVCGNAANEACPAFPGGAVRAHWGVSDPAAVEGTDEDKLRAFRRTLDVLRRRVQQFTGLPFESTHPRALRDAMADIGQA